MVRIRDSLSRRRPPPGRLPAPVRWRSSNRLQRVGLESADRRLGEGELRRLARRHRVSGWRAGGLNFALVRPGAESVAWLWTAIAEAEGADPLGPVTVVVPSNHIGQALRR